jgi:nitrogen fixation-related uncharacterized protein
MEHQMRNILLVVAIGLVIGWLFSWAVGASQIEAEAS